MQARDDRTTPLLSQLAACEAFLERATSELGVSELPGDASNPRIVEYLKTCKLAPRYIRDETAWCSAFANWVTAQCDVPGTGKANARSWLSWGVPTAEPVPGCIVVFSRPPLPWSGHVSFFLRRIGENVWVRGGNQRNSVCDAVYPASRLLGFRLPSIEQSLSRRGELQA